MSTTTETVTDKALQKRLIFAWLDALRSGEWKQSTGGLEDKNGNCCLGLACRLAMRDGFELKTEIVDQGGCVAFNGVTAYVPVALRDAMGLDDSAGRYITANEVTALAWQNDRGKTFPEIADIIEANARTLFVNGHEVSAWISERNQQH